MILAEQDADPREFPFLDSRELASLAEDGTLHPIRSLEGTRLYSIAELEDWIRAAL